MMEKHPNKTNTNASIIEGILNTVTAYLNYFLPFKVIYSSMLEYAYNMLKVEYKDLDMSRAFCKLSEF